MALGLIFVLLYMAFGAEAALLIYLNVPFAAVGGVLLLAARGMPFSISAAIGFIALFGIAVLNGVVLLTTIKKLRAKGVGPLEAADSARSRASRGGDDRDRRGARVLPHGALVAARARRCSGRSPRWSSAELVSATFLTLFVLPTVYAFVYRKERPCSHSSRSRVSNCVRTRPLEVSPSPSPTTSTVMAMPMVTVMGADTRTAARSASVRSSSSASHAVC
jgi:cobalt-zinc-cadmium resistance protein CzcA